MGWMKIVPKTVIKMAAAPKIRNVLAIVLEAFAALFSPSALETTDAPPTPTIVATAPSPIMTGEMIDAQEGYRLGAIERVVPREQLRATAREIAAKIAAKSPAMIRLAKEALNGIEDGNLEDKYRSEQGFTLVGWSDTCHLEDASLDEAGDGETAAERGTVP